jgi:4-amino-4-deoxy-L-arabinose transferase-like glycosyltransferase
MVKFSGLPDPLEPRRLRERVLPFVLLYGFALLLRVVYAWIAPGPGASPSSDPLEYDQVAWNLATGHGFAIGEGLARHPTAFVPPVLPWLVSWVYKVFGRDYFAAVLFQATIGALVPLLVVRLGAPLFGGGVAFAAGVLAAVHPLLVFFSGYLMTETLFSAVMLWAMIVSVEVVRFPSGRRAFWTGIAWGAAALTRPTALLLPLITLAWAWAPLSLMLDAKTLRRYALYAAAGLALVIGPWTIRNAMTFGAFIPVTTGGGQALLDSNNPEVWDNPALRGGAGLDRTSEPYASLLAQGTELERDARARGAALEFAFSRVGDWPVIAWAKFWRFWRVSAEGGGTGGWQREGSPLGALLRAIDPLLLWSIVVMPLAIWGAVGVARGARRLFQSYPAWVILYFTLLALVFWGSLRMRLPVEPLVVLFAAAGGENLWRRWRTRNA